MTEPYENADWRTSTRSGSNGACVEVATNLLASRGVVLLRDTKDRSVPPFAFTEAEWEAFIGGAKDGEFDL